MSKLKFYCKADSQDLSKVGDCPFCHKVQLGKN